jgi:hypothetical protein
MGSSNILSMDRGPSVVRMISLTAFAAFMLPNCSVRVRVFVCKAHDY